MDNPDETTPRATTTGALTRRSFNRSLLAGATVAMIPTAWARAAGSGGRTPDFYIQHWASTKGVHPYKGHPANHGSVVIHSGNYDHTRFYFQFVEGPWGYIVYAPDPEYCIHPQGGSVTASAGTGLLFSKGRHPGAYFAFNQQQGAIGHISGLFWHVYHGKTADGTSVILSNGIHDKAKFIPTQGSHTQPFDLDLPAQVSGDWKLVFADDNPLSDRVRKYTMEVGFESSKSTSSTTQVTAGIEMEGQLFGQSSKASLEIQRSWSSESSETRSEKHTVDAEYSIKSGQPVAVWQRVYRANFQDGASFNYFSATVFRDTVGSHIKPSN